MVAAPGHRTIDEGVVDPVAQRLEGFDQHWRMQQGLLHDLRQFRVDGRSAVGLDPALPAFALTADQAGLLQAVDLALHGTSAALGLGQKLGEAEPAFGLAVHQSQHPLLGGGEQGVGHAASGSGIHTPLIPNQGFKVNP